MFDAVLNTVSSSVSLLYPLLSTYKALKTSDPAKLREWLMYWSVFSTILLAESVSKTLLDLIPMYSTTRLFFILFLLLPESRGHKYLFEAFLQPILDTYEDSIDDIVHMADQGVQTLGSVFLKQVMANGRSSVARFMQSNKVK